MNMNKYFYTFLSIGITFVIWCCIFVVLYCIKLPEHETYKTISITLSSSPVEKNESHDAVNGEVVTQVEDSDFFSTEDIHDTHTEVVNEVNTNIANALDIPVESAPEKNKQAAEPKVTKVSEKSEVKQPNETIYKKSVEDLAKDNRKKRSEKSVKWDESLFSDSDDANEDKIEREEVVFSSSFSGTSAMSSESSVPVTGSKSIQSDDTGELSSSTKSALSDIKSQNEVKNASAGGKVGTKSDYVNDNGIVMSNGKSRDILNPKNPSIYISDENSRLLDSSRTVKITFSVLSDGTVPLGEIYIRPSLPVSIEKEIKQQICKWIFVSDLQEDSVQATFNYTLEIR